MIADSSKATEEGKDMNEEYLDKIEEATKEGPKKTKLEISLEQRFNRLLKQSQAFTHEIVKRQKAVAKERLLKEVMAEDRLLNCVQEEAGEEEGAAQDEEIFKVSEQPSCLAGGKLAPHQIDSLNWMISRSRASTAFSPTTWEWARPSKPSRFLGVLAPVHFKQRPTPEITPEALCQTG